MMMVGLDPAGYGELLAELKGRVRAARVRAALAVNRELVTLYWGIGRAILERQGREGWGARTIERLSRDLRAEFPEMKGLSPRNLRYMRAFAEAWPEEAIVQGVLAQITWYHNIALIEKLPDREARLWYAAAAVEFGWSRNVLALQIDSGVRQRQGQAITNFARTLPEPQSDLVQNLIKDPYAFDFLTLHDGAVERDLERGLLEHLKAFMLELGVGFALLGSQVHLAVGEEDFFVDLLFYHVRLHCYVVIDLKMGRFKPEYAGKLNFYLSAVDGLLRGAEDGPTIGLLLCRGKDGLVVEYALRDIQKPIGVSTFRVGDALPAELLGNLPTVEQLETELGKVGLGEEERPTSDE